MLAMLVVATALSRISTVHSSPTNELSQFDEPHLSATFLDDEMADITEQFLKNDYENIIIKRNSREEKFEPSQNKPSPSSNLKVPKRKAAMVFSKNSAATVTNYEKVPTKPGTVPKQKLINASKTKKPHIHHDEVDVADREDHITQYLADQNVNTDSEISSIQASEIDDDRESSEEKEDTYFAFLTGLGKAVEVEGPWSNPADNDDLWMVNPMFL